MQDARISSVLVLALLVSSFGLRILMQQLQVLQLPMATYQTIKFYLLSLQKIYILTINVFTIFYSRFL